MAGKATPFNIPTLPLLRSFAVLTHLFKAWSFNVGHAIAERVEGLCPHPRRGQEHHGQAHHESSDAHPSSHALHTDVHFFLLAHAPRSSHH
jgi:hypothetical protein